MSDIEFQLGALRLHPIKSCAAVAVDRALLLETGLELDRAWMLVDRDGEMLTQRELPRLALVRPTLRGDEMVLRAPGMLALHVALDRVGEPTRVRVWDDVVRAYDIGALAAQWFSDYVGAPVQLVRFDPEERRLSDPRWAGTSGAQTAFADGYALLVVGRASLADLDARLAARGVAPAALERFRPNLVLDGLQPYDEDHIDELLIDTGEGSARLRLVKPCVRCDIPNVDPASAEVGGEPGATLAGYRADPRLGGGITFGVNAIVVDGVEQLLRVGQRGRATLRI